MKKHFGEKLWAEGEGGGRESLNLAAIARNKKKKKKSQRQTPGFREARWQGVDMKRHERKKEQKKKKRK